MNNKAFYNLSYGVFVLTTKAEGIANGCITNTCIQVANEPTRLLISVLNKNYTCELIKKSQMFTVSVLDERTTFNTIKHFGFQSGRDVQKIDDSYPVDVNDIPYFEKQANAVFSCKVISQNDLGSHTTFVGEVIDAQLLSTNRSITYADYQANIKPKSQLKVDDREIVAYKCKICGYVYEGAKLPEDYICPLCGHDASDFEPVYKEKEPENKEENKMAKWVCKVCGYVYEGAELPADFKCPTCKAPAKMFEEVKGEVKLAAEHTFGVYASTVANNPNVSDEDKAYILEQLKANFNGECSEVGMYLCMARIAHREGYPEIGLYWEKAAYEEAEHAAKFAELLGSECEVNMTDSTEKNLAWRIDCEYGATNGKFDLAKVAKADGLDAIHDTVHEMARDEARHGKAFAGLLKRYFGK